MRFGSLLDQIQMDIVQLRQKQGEIVVAPPKTDTFEEINQRLEEFNSQFERRAKNLFTDRKHLLII